MNWRKPKESVETEHIPNELSQNRAVVRRTSLR